MIWRFRTTPLVSMCIPAYKSEAFISNVLERALSQTVQDIEIIVSNDGGFETPSLLQYRKHPKVRICTQRRRLGWVKNTNAALAQAKGAFFMVLPHDDWLEPTYLEECLNVLKHDDHVFAAYSDIELNNGRILKASEVRGTLPNRVFHVMRNLFNGYSYRALMRRRPADWQNLKLRENPPTNFCADSTWMLQQALLGDLKRIPKPLYIKKFHSRNTHSTWRDIPDDALVNAWTYHCHTLGELAKRQIQDDAWVDSLVQHRLNPHQVREAPAFLCTAFSAHADQNTVLE